MKKKNSFSCLIIKIRRTWECVFFPALCLLSHGRGEIPSSTKCTHPHRRDPSADYLQSIVIETKDGATLEIYNSPNSYGCVKTWGVVGGGVEKGSPCLLCNKQWFTDTCLQ